jgi:hypothetical protein
MPKIGLEHKTTEEKNSSIKLPFNPLFYTIESTPFGFTLFIKV